MCLTMYLPINCKQNERESERERDREREGGEGKQWVYLLSLVTISNSIIFESEIMFLILLL